MVRLRERLIPLVDLAEELGLDGGGGGFVVVLQVGKHRFGVRVGEVIDTEEIVVKPLSSVVRGMPQFSGATILGDGSVILILDPNALSERAGTLPASVEAQEAAAWESSAADDVRTLLIVHAGRGAPKAVDLSRVTRLEHVPASDVQRLGDRASLYYRGRLLPVLTVDESQALKDSGVQPILVFTGDTYALALAVDRIVDVVETRLSLELAPNRPGILGVAAVSGQATDVLDVNHFMLQALAEHIRGDDGHDEAAKAAA